MNDSYWVSLRWLAASRVAIALVLLAFVPLHDGKGLEAALDPSLFSGTAVLYLLLAVLYLSTLHRVRARFTSVLLVHALTDLFALATLMHATGGLRSGLVVLLIAALAGAAVVSTLRMAALFAAVATLLVLGEAAWGVAGDGDAGLLLLAGLVGIACFATAMTVNWLATRLHAQEQIARTRGDDLRRQLAVTSRVVAELAHGVLVVDGSGMVRTINPAARALLGLGADAPRLVPAVAAAPASGNPASASREARDRTVPDAAWAKLQQAYARWRSEMPSRPAETDLDLPASHGGTTRVRLRFLATAEPSDDTVVMLEDQRLVEERAQQLKLAAMGRLSASIAHEIRNPLGAIRHANGLLGERLDEPTLVRLSRIVEANTVRIDRIIESVLSIARRERAADEAIDLAAFLDRLLPEFVASHGVPPSRIAVRLQTDRPIRFDSGHLRQVLLNLLGNALRHASQADAAVVITWSERDLHRLELTVADDGSGLTSEMLVHAFEPFFTTESRGTGLGLYLARELCNANAATIRYEAAVAPQRYCSAFVIEPQPD